MANLLRETLEILSAQNKTSNDVKWVGCSTHKTTWENFSQVADIDYNDSYGSPKVAMDLIICGDNWWLERGEYDGSEWWVFKKLPETPVQDITLRSVTNDGYMNLIETNTSKTNAT